METLVVWRQVTESGDYVPNSVEHYVATRGEMDPQAGPLEVILEAQGQTWVGKVVRVHKDLVQIVLDIQPQGASQWALMDPKNYEWQNRPDPRNG